MATEHGGLYIMFLGPLSEFSGSATAYYLQYINGFFFHVQSLFGLAFDIDGVLVRGSDGPLPEALKMFDGIACKQTRRLQFPTVFLTNACGCDVEKAEKLRKWFNIKVLQHAIVILKVIKFKQSNPTTLNSLFILLSLAHWF